MLKAQKETTVQALSERFGKAKAAIVAEYRGLTVGQMTALRKKISDAEGGFQVVKNRLAKRALTTEALKPLEPLLVGPTGVATVEKDVVLLAKALTEFAKDNELFKIKGGVVEGKAMKAAELGALATLPSREQLLASLLSVMNGPARNLASVLAAVPRSLVTVLKAIGDKKPA